MSGIRIMANSLCSYLKNYLNKLLNLICILNNRKNICTLVLGIGKECCMRLGAILMTISWNIYSISRSNRKSKINKLKPTAIITIHHYNNNNNNQIIFKNIKLAILNNKKIMNRNSCFVQKTAIV